MKKCQLKVKCPSFGADGQIPKKHTGFAEDISPEILIDGFMNTVKSVAIIMDDLDVPLKKELNQTKYILCRRKNDTSVTNISNRY